MVKTTAARDKLGRRPNSHGSGWLFVFNFSILQLNQGDRSRRHTPKLLAPPPRTLTSPAGSAAGSKHRLAKRLIVQPPLTLQF